MRQQKRHKNPSSHHMRGKGNPVPHTHDHGKEGKLKGTKGKAVGNRPIRPTAVKVRHHAPLSDGSKTRRALNKVYI